MPSSHSCLEDVISSSKTIDFLLSNPKADIVNTILEDSRITPTIREYMADIVEADGPTKKHSYNVPQYALELLPALSDYMTKHGINVYDFLVGCVIHDVGKKEHLDIFDSPIPQINREYQEWHIQRSTELAAEAFGDNHYITRLIAEHHPYGPCTDEPICPSAELLKVLDSYDAQVTDRGYNNVKTPEGALQSIFNNQNPNEFLDELEPIIVPELLKLEEKLVA